MTLRDPWQRLSVDTRRRIFTLAGVLAIVLTIALTWLGNSLKTAAAPDRIISFEFAATHDRSAAILTSWTPAQRNTAEVSLIVDYAYLVSYAIAISIGCAVTGGRLRQRRPDLANVAVALSWAALLAGTLDAVENAALLRQLTTGPGATTARIATVAAMTKFALVAMSLPCALLALLPDRTKS